MTRLGDAALLVLAMLIGAAGRHHDAIVLIDQAMANRYSEDFVLAATATRDHLQRAAHGCNERGLI